MRAKRMSRAQNAYYEREVPLAGVLGRYSIPYLE